MKRYIIYLIGFFLTLLPSFSQAQLKNDEFDQAKKTIIKVFRYSHLRKFDSLSMILPTITRGVKKDSLDKKFNDFAKVVNVDGIPAISQFSYDSTRSRDKYVFLKFTPMNKEALKIDSILFAFNKQNGFERIPLYMVYHPRKQTVN